MNNNYKLLEKLKEYEQEHSDLDQILIQLQEKHTCLLYTSPSPRDS